MPPDRALGETEMFSDCWGIEVSPIGQQHDRALADTQPLDRVPDIGTEVRKLPVISRTSTAFQSRTLRRPPTPSSGLVENRSKQVRPSVPHDSPARRSQHPNQRTRYDIRSVPATDESRGERDQL